ncbi:hypothetical protein [Pseudomonas prosekii]|uniref:hypothetical protein n=1 Tax=Pseudomonas prosekii TaxID=1148509 RepID=UPI0012FE5D52|nr:hypothetical protein [Pseudomonas prosekii]
MSVFSVAPIDTASGKPQKDAPNQIWYVLEGDYVHFKCTDPIQALAILAYIKKTTIPAYRRCTELAHAFYEKGDVSADATSLFAKNALTKLEWTVSKIRQTKLPDYVRSPTKKPSEKNNIVDLQNHNESVSNGHKKNDI